MFSFNINIYVPPSEAGTVSSFATTADGLEAMLAGTGSGSGGGGPGTATGSESAYGEQRSDTSGTQCVVNVSSGRRRARGFSSLLFVWLFLLPLAALFFSFGA